MKVRLIKRKSIEDFAAKNARSRSSFMIWLTLLRQADWIDPGDISQTFGSSHLLGNESDHYFGSTMVHLYIKWIGTHAEYTRLCANQLQYTVNKF
jgi:mRNA interferase HigB